MSKPRRNGIKMAVCSSANELEGGSLYIKSIGAPSYTPSFIQNNQPFKGKCDKQSRKPFLPLLPWTRAEVLIDYHEKAVV